MFVCTLVHKNAYQSVSAPICSVAKTRCVFGSRLATEITQLRAVQTNNHVTRLEVGRCILAMKQLCLHALCLLAMKHCVYMLLFTCHEAVVFLSFWIL